MHSGSWPFSYSNVTQLVYNILFNVTSLYHSNKLWVSVVLCWMHFCISSIYNSYYVSMHSMQNKYTKWYRWKTGTCFELLNIWLTSCAFSVQHDCGLSITPTLMIGMCWCDRRAQSRKGSSNHSIVVISLTATLPIIIFTPRACARGEAIVCRCRCCRRHENRQISSSRRIRVL